MNSLVDYIELKIPAKPEFVSIVRLTLSGVSSKMGFSYDEIEDLKVATSEACTNAVQHAYKNNEYGDITVGFAMYKNRLEVMISDKGQSFDFEQTKKDLGPYNPSIPVEELPEGGLGMYIMESLMDEVRIQINSGVTVFMTKFLDGERANYDATITNYQAN